MWMAMITILGRQVHVPPFFLNILEFMIATSQQAHRQNPVSESIESTVWICPHETLRGLSVLQFGGAGCVRV
jgi:hypothetical protein